MIEFYFIFLQFEDAIHCKGCCETEFPLPYHPAQGRHEDGGQNKNILAVLYL